MFFIIVILIIAATVIFLAKRFLSYKLGRLKSNFYILRKHFEGLNDKLAGIKKRNKKLEEEFRERAAFYEMTKLISKSLDQEEVLLAFRKNIKQFIECKDCRFLGKDAEVKIKDTLKYFPIKMRDDLLGYIVVEELKDGDEDTMKILINQLKLVIKKINLFAEIQRLSITDSLTQVFNRRYLLHRLNQEFRRSLRYNLGISVVMIDIDLFKECNDKFGHFVGDIVLREVTDLIKQNIRNIDFLGRYGGEEFLLVLPSTARDAACVVAERIRAAVENRAIKAYDETVKTTISLGVVSLLPEVKKAQELIDMSDFALYRAKKTGRNRVCAYGIYEQNS